METYVLWSSLIIYRLYKLDFPDFSESDLSEWFDTLHTLR